MSPRSDSCEQIDLAVESPFLLGELAVDPTRLCVRRGVESLRLEARVMQVLVVLARADGQVVSRADLVERCWDGRIVGENALQRVISRLRHLSATLGGFELETVTKVGYILHPELAEMPQLSPPLRPQSSAPAPFVPAGPAPAGVSRRRLIWASGAIAAGGAAILAWPLTASGSSNAEAARHLVRKAYEAGLTGELSNNTQAIAYLKRATELDPTSATAWGDLALAYQGRMGESDDSALAALAAWVRSAAARALAIDPATGSAHLALATIPPNFRHWAANERSLRQIQQIGRPHPALQGALGCLLSDTGRWQEAIICLRGALAVEPYDPCNQLNMASALWGGGKLDEVERVLENAYSLWPNSRSVWQSRFNFLVLTGKTGMAAAALDDSSARPLIDPEQEPPPYAALRDFTRAMHGARPAEVAQLVNRLIDLRGSLGTCSVVAYLCALGQIDAAFAMLESYFFGSATRPAPGPLVRRATSILFSAQSAPLRTDPRFARLLWRIDLQSYWRQTGTRADPRLASMITL